MKLGLGESSLVNTVLHADTGCSNLLVACCGKSSGASWLWSPESTVNPWVSSRVAEQWRNRQCKLAEWVLFHATFSKTLFSSYSQLLCRLLLTKLIGPSAYYLQHDRSENILLNILWKFKYSYEYSAGSVVNVYYCIGNLTMDNNSNNRTTQRSLCPNERCNCKISKC